MALGVVPSVQAGDGTGQGMSCGEHSYFTQYILFNPRASELQFSRVDGAIVVAIQPEQ
jgi:hypothetical protein